MRLKTFYAKNMTDAMRQVRDTLGEDAIIIATRDEDGGKSVRVTAAIEQFDMDTPSLPDPYPEDYTPLSERTTRNNTPSSQPMDDYLAYDQENEDEGLLTEHLTNTLFRHVVPNSVMDTILSTASMTGHSDNLSALGAALDHLYGFTPLPQKSRKPLMFVGAPGTGKTLLVAKLATQAVMNGVNVAVITTDTVRAGGVEQLQAFTKILKIPLLKAKTQQDLKTLINDCKGHDLVLIDTAGTNPHDPDDMARIARFFDAGPIEPVLTMTAGIDAEEAAEISSSFALLGVKRMVSTRLDVARRLGGILSAAQSGNMSFCNISYSPKVTDGIADVTAQDLALFLINTDKALKQFQNPSNHDTINNMQTAGRAQ